MNSGTGSIYRLGKVYWIYYGHRGKRHRKSSQSKRKKDARELLRKRMEEIGKGRLIGPDPEKVTLGDLGKMLVTDYEGARAETPCRRKICEKAEAEGLEPPRACARRISSAVPYQLGLRLRKCRSPANPACRL